MGVVHANRGAAGPEDLGVGAVAGVVAQHERGPLVPGQPSERAEQPVRLPEVALIDLGVGKPP